MLRTSAISIFLLSMLALGCSKPLTVAETPTDAKAADGSYISWKEHLIDDEGVNGGVPIRGGDGLQMADLDQDGFEDIVSVHEDNHHVRLAFGTGDPDKWVLATLAEGAEAAAAEDASVADANGDGWPDIVVASELAHLIYFQNPGNVPQIRSGDWPRTIPRKTQMRGSWIRVFFADYDGDGRPEVSAPNKGDQLGYLGSRPDAFEDKAVSWFDLPADPLAEGDQWEEHVLYQVKLPMNAQPVDLDGDGDLEIFSGTRFEMRPFWFENQGGSPPEFVYHAIEVTGRNEPKPEKFQGKRLTGMNVVFEDMNKDGRLDVILQETPLIVVWMEQPAGFDQPWPLHKIGDLGPDTSTGLALADINGDGRLDLMTGGYSSGLREADSDKVTVDNAVGRLAWWEQPEDVSQEWTLHNISRRKRGMYDAFIPRDLDGDGDVDFVTTRGNSAEFDGVLWLEQVRTKQPVPNFQPARASESQHLPMP
ncbi:MAG: VCBS repeat-containing protein [Acidobacteria bacterium]|nr:VCBS repeat-containing protein [Acidobacteriota bacterium]